MKSIILLTGKQLEMLNALSESLTARAIAYKIKVNQSHIRQLAKRLIQYELIKLEYKQDINYSNNIKFYAITEKGKTIRKVFGETDNEL